MARSLTSLARLASAASQHSSIFSLRGAAAAPPSLSSLAPTAPAGTPASWRFMSADHTAKWMQNTDMKSPMELIADVPPIKVDARVVACEGGMDPALGHPVEYINLDGQKPAVCKYCGLRYEKGDAHGHH